MWIGAIMQATCMVMSLVIWIPSCGKSRVHPLAEFKTVKVVGDEKVYEEVQIVEKDSIDHKNILKFKENEKEREHERISREKENNIISIIQFQNLTSEIKNQTKSKDLDIEHIIVRGLNDVDMMNFYDEYLEYKEYKVKEKAIKEMEYKRKINLSRGFR
jgi:hypothetical protein